MQRTAICAACLLAAFAGACARTAASAEGRVELAKEDRDFIARAAQGSLLEMELGRVASRQAAAPDVKAFGEEMVRDHRTADTELAQIASSKGYQPPMALDSSHQSKLEDMQKWHGSKLDERYAQQMVADDEREIEDFEDAAKTLKDPDLREWATKSVPLFRSHLDQAKALKSKYAR